MAVTGSGFRPSREMTVIDGAWADARNDRPAISISAAAAATYDRRKFTMSQ
jgi:hypothetical protein